MAQQHHGNPNYGMAQQPSQPSRVPMGHQDRLLLVYVVDYCEKQGFKDSAAALKREGRLQDTKPPTDSKEGLLYEWWICFWDIYTARVHPDKPTSTKAAKLYAESLNHPRFGRPRDGGQFSDVRMGGGPPPPGSAAHSAPGVNGQGPSGASYGTNPPGMNGVQPPPTTSGAMPGMPAANLSMLNPTLQHLQQQRVSGYSAQGPGMQMQQVYIQRPQGPAGAPMGAMGQMVPMGQQQQRMSNGVVYAQNYRPQPGQQSPQQQQEMQTTGASGSPKQPGAPSTAQNSSPHLQGANGNAHDPSGMEQGTPRNQPSRGQKRPSPAEDDQYSKDASPPDRKKPRRSPQENGSTLPTTPSFASAQPQPGNGRTPMQTGAFSGMAPNKPNPMMGGMSFPAPGMTNGPPLGGLSMPPAMTGQLRELTQAHPQHTQRVQGATPQQTHQIHQTDQQYFTQMQQTSMNSYNINKPIYPPSQNPTLTGPPGVAAEPAVRGATNAPKGSMLPPPPPNPSTGQSAPGTGNSTPSKSTPVMSGLQPRNVGNKDSSSPREGVSPEIARPGSRPIPGSTPQTTPAPIPGTASTPGGPSAISAPSPSQMATPQQISRPQTQSPSQAALARPSSATTNGLPGGGAPLNPSVILARFGGGAQPGGMNGAAGGAQAGHTPSNAGMGSSNDMLVGGPLTTDMFMSLNNNVPFDMQMMGYQEDDPFATTMGLDFAAGFNMDESYNTMSMYINEPSLDNGA